jgi:hypothetical protein
MNSILTDQQRPEPTRDMKLKNRAFEVKNIARNAYETISRIQKRGVDIVWNDSDFTPQEIINELGADALKIFQYHGALTTYLVTLAQAEGMTPDIKLPTNAFVIDPQTGSITVTEDPYDP